jgi:hypothetical protein
MTTSFTHDSSHLARTYDRLSDSQFASASSFGTSCASCPKT